MHINILRYFLITITTENPCYYFHMIEKKKYLIKRIDIEDFCDVKNSFEPINIKEDLKFMNFIIGENGSGKTSVIRVLYNLIYGTHNVNFSYKKFEVSINNEDKAISSYNKIMIPNWFREMYDTAKEHGLNCHATNWKDRGPKDNDAKLELSGVIFANKLKKVITSIILKIYKKEINESEINLNADRTKTGFTNFFVNNINLSDYAINGIFAERVIKKGVITDLRDNLRQFIYEADFSGVDYLKDLDAIAKKYDFTEKEMNDVKVMMQKFANSSKRANLYMNNLISKNFKRERTSMESEFIFSDRLAVDAMKRMEHKPNVPAHLSDTLFKHELNKENWDSMKKYNNELNNAVNLANKRILSMMSSIDVRNTKDYNLNEFEVLKNALSKMTSKDTEWLREIFSGDSILCKAIISHIMNEKDILELIREVIKRSNSIDLCIRHMNKFIGSTFKHIIVRGEADIEVSYDVGGVKTNVPIQKYYFSNGQKSLLYLIANIFLVEKRLYVIDEPELGLSVIWQDEFRRMLLTLKDSGKQFIIITHSTYVFKRSGDNVCVIPL